MLMALHEVLWLLKTLGSEGMRDFVRDVFTPVSDGSLRYVVNYLQLYLNNKSLLIYTHKPQIYPYLDSFTS